MSILDRIAAGGNFNIGGSILQGQQIAQDRQLREAQVGAIAQRQANDSKRLEMQEEQSNLAAFLAQQNQAQQAQAGILAGYMLDNDPSNDAIAAQGLARLPGGLQQLGGIKALTAPSKDTRPTAVQTAEAFMSMTPEQQSAFHAANNPGLAIQHRNADRADARFNFDVADRTADNTRADRQLAGVEQARIDKTNRTPKLSAAAAGAAGFHSRMIETGSIIERYESDPNFNPASFWGRSAGRIPVIGRWAQSEDHKLYANAAKNWIRANLRKESGAVIGADEEADEYKTYFPIVGDTPALIRQKSELRKVTEQAMAMQAQITQQEAPQFSGSNIVWDE